MPSVKFHLSIFLLLTLVIVAHSQENLCTRKGIFGSKCPADKEEEWTYRGRKGPMYWGALKPDYRTCYGRNQSPIDINTRRVRKDRNLAPLGLENYEVPLGEATIENNGHTIEVVPRDEVERTVTINNKTYSLRQFHFHWCCHYFRGSEHAVNGKYYAAELHFVHVSNDNKIAVLGVFLEEKDAENSELQKIFSQLFDVMFKGTEVELSSKVNLNNLVPKNPTSYYRYEGSLTTPPCSEGVTWSVIPDPIPVGRSQMDKLRSLYSSTKENASRGCKLACNDRPVQPLNDRTVYLSR